MTSISQIQNESLDRCKIFADALFRRLERQMTEQPPNPPPPGKHQIQRLEVPEDMEPAYVNVVRITHSPSELVLDFARMLPGLSPSKVISRLLMSPLSAKLFYQALGENLTKYEANFGEIKIPGGTSSLADHLFRPPQNE
jgi:hypothetical protein